MGSNPVCAVTGRTSGLDEHHKIPRAYGGETGPTIWLASDIHQLVHTLALELYRTGDISALPLPPEVPPNKRKLVLELVKTIVIARRRYEAAKAVGDAPVRGAAVKLDSKRKRKVEDLARRLNLNQAQVVNAAIDRLHQKMTSSVRTEQNGNDAESSKE